MSICTEIGGLERHPSHVVEKQLVILLLVILLIPEFIGGVAVCDITISCSIYCLFIYLHIFFYILILYSVVEYFFFVCLSFYILKHGNT